MFTTLTIILVIALAFLMYTRIKSHIDEFIFLQKETYTASNLIRLANFGFYIWNNKDRTNEFSPKIQVMFNSVFCSFEEFANLFDNHKNLKAEVHKAKNSPHTFSLELKIKNHNKCYLCYGKSLLATNKSKISHVILYIDDLSEEKNKIDKLESEKIKLKKEIKEAYSLINNIPIPLWQKSENNHIIYNRFYKNFMKNIENSIKIPKKSKEINIIINNHNKQYRITESKNNNNIICYGEDITETKKIEAKIKNYALTQKEVISNITSPIAIYTRNQMLKIYNAPFLKMYQLSEPNIRSGLSFTDVINHAIRKNIFLETKESILSQKNEVIKLFSTIIEPYHNTIETSNNELYKVLITPHPVDGLLFIYEYIKKPDK